MLSSINPLGERARGNSWALTAVYYFAGSMAGGALSGLVAATAGTLLPFRLAPKGALAGFAVAAAVAGLAEWRAVPSWHRQVNEDWLVRYRAWVYGGGFGFQLGSGLATTVSSAAVYLWLLGCLVGASPLAGAAVGACFGLVRAAPILTVAKVRSPAQLLSLHRRIAAAAPAARRAATAGLALVASTAAAVAAMGA